MALVNFTSGEKEDMGTLNKTILVVSLFLGITSTWALQSVDNTLSAMTMSHSYSLAQGSDLAAVEMQGLQDFITSKLFPSNSKEVILIRYDIGDTNVLNTLLNA